MQFVNRNSFSSPLKISMLIHFYTFGLSGRVFPNINKPAQQEIIKEFLSNGIIVDTYTKDVYRTTSKGVAWLERICNVLY